VAVTDDVFDDRLLDGVADLVEELTLLPAPALAAALRPRLADALQAQRPDGSWPAPAALLEVVRAYAEVLDAALARDGFSLDGDERSTAQLATALHELVDHPDRFEATLEQLRTEQTPTDFASGAW
jgi:hypothetical protein